MFPEDVLSHDAFLCGRLYLWQPVHGYRAATDPVFLAAACPALAGQRVLDLGCGAGAASLCLGARVAGLHLVGLEIQPGYAALARRNAAENNIMMQVEEGDLIQIPKTLRVDFDHVIANPPYYAKGGTPSPRKGRAMAMHVETPLAHWVQAATRRLRPGGILTMILGTDGLPEVLAALSPRMGSAAVLPLTARHGRESGRIILRARKGGRAAFRLLAPLIIHQGIAHEGDRENYTTRANEVLRLAASLSAEFD